MTGAFKILGPATIGLNSGLTGSGLVWWRSWFGG